MRPYSPGQQQQQQHVSTGNNRHGPSALRERSASGETGSSGMPSPQTQPEIYSHTSTAAQPTPHDHTDTRLDRPAQPSSGSAGNQQQLHSPQGVPSPYQGVHRERSNSTEMSSVIPIISNPGLTGRHIAAISSNQPPPGGYPTNSQSQPPLPTAHQPPPLPPSHSFRGQRGKSEYGTDSSPLPPPPPPPTGPTHPTTLHLVASGGSPQGVQNASPVGKITLPGSQTFGQLAAVAAAIQQQSSLTSTVISSSASSSSSSSSLSSVNSPGVVNQPNSLPLSVTGSPLSTSLSPSRRPGIIRKRPHESGWTGSPNFNKIPFGSNTGSPGQRSDNGATHPLSPSVSTSSAHSDHLTNHIAPPSSSSANTAGGQTDLAPPTTNEVIPSPRKKRRKQDVIVTDDQYASNVPNNIRPDVAMAMDTDHVSPRHHGSAVAMTTRTRGRPEDSSNQREESGELNNKM